MTPIPGHITPIAATLNDDIGNETALHAPLDKEIHARLATIMHCLSATNEDEPTAPAAQEATDIDTYASPNVEESTATATAALEN